MTAREIQRCIYQSITVLKNSFNNMRAGVQVKDNSKWLRDCCCCLFRHIYPV